MKKLIITLGAMCVSLAAVACGEGEDDDGPIPAGDGDGDGDGDGAEPPSEFATNGFGSTANGWEGYLFTVPDAVGGNITPAEGAAFVGPSLCAKGMTGASYEGFGIIGFNIAQEIDPETMAGGDPVEIAPGGTGVQVKIVNNVAGTQMRVQLQDNALTSWCAPIPAAGEGIITWDQFNTTCWNGMGSGYDPTTPISQVMVQAVSGSDMVPTAFDFCIVNLDLAP